MRPLVVSLFSVLLLSLLRYASSTFDGTTGSDIDIAYYVAMGASSTLCVLRAVVVPAQRVAWILLSAVLVSDLVADLSSYYLTLPYPSFADAIWLLSYLWMFGGIVFLLVPLTGRWNRLLTLDWLIATFTASALAALLILPPIVDALPSDSLESAVTVAYPVADILVLASLAVAVGVGVGRPSFSLGLIVIAGAVWVIGDAVYSRQVAEGSYVDGGFIDLTWPLAAGLIAAAAWAPQSSAGDLFAATRRAGWLSGACMLAALLVTVPPESHHDNRLAFYLALTALALGGLRLILTQRENRNLLHAANTDPLTGVGSRAKLVTDEMTFRDRNLTVAVLDLDGFKFYNDTFGHPAGDVLLRRIAGRLTETLGDRGEIYRIGGDEFCVLMLGYEHRGGIARELSEATHMTGDGFEITASVGIASYPEGGPSWTTRSTSRTSGCTPARTARAPPPGVRCTRCWSGRSGSANPSSRSTRAGCGC